MTGDYRVVGRVFGLGDIGRWGDNDELDMDNGEGCSFDLSVGQLEALLAIAKAAGLEATPEETWPQHS